MKVIIDTPMTIANPNGTPFTIRGAPDIDWALDKVAKHMEGIWTRADLTVRHTEEE